MKKHLNTLFTDNPGLEEQIEDFCRQNQTYVRAEREFYETADQVARLVGFERYDIFERRFAALLNCTADLYYLFGLGLRQEVVSALAGE